MLKRLSAIFTAIALFVFVHIPEVLAQGIKNAGNELSKVSNASGVTEGDLGNVVGTIINAALTLVGVIFLGLTVYAGILWMTARGNEEQIKKSQGIIIASIIGLVITVSAYAITAFVTARFEG